MSEREHSKRRKLSFLLPFTKPAIRSFATLARPGSFRFLVPVTIGISCGDYVLLSSLERTFLGQVNTISFDFTHERQISSISVLEMSQEVASIVPSGYYTGSGQLLAEIVNSKAKLDFDRYNCGERVSINIAPYGAIESYFTEAYSNKDPSFSVNNTSNISSVTVSPSTASLFSATIYVPANYPTTTYTKEE